MLTKMRNWSLQNPTVLLTVGIVVTLVITLIIVLVLLRVGGGKPKPDNAAIIADNAAVIGAVIALGGVFTTQLVTAGLANRRPRGRTAEVL
jgi:uncharacterized SAM-binding protein YcdF (DUF218 family)